MDLTTSVDDCVSRRSRTHAIQQGAISCLSRPPFRPSLTSCVTVSDLAKRGLVYEAPRLRTGPRRGHGPVPPHRVPTRHDVVGAPRLPGSHQQLHHSTSATLVSTTSRSDVPNRDELANGPSDSTSWASNTATSSTPATAPDCRSAIRTTLLSSYSPPPAASAPPGADGKNGQWRDVVPSHSSTSSHAHPTEEHRHVSPPHSPRSPTPPNPPTRSARRPATDDRSPGRVVAPDHGGTMSDVASRRWSTWT